MQLPTKIPHILYYRGYYGSLEFIDKTVCKGEVLFTSPTISYSAPGGNSAITSFHSKVDVLLKQLSLTRGPFPYFSDFEWKLILLLYTYQSDEPYIDNQPPKKITVQQYHIIHALNMSHQHNQGVTCMRCYVEDVVKKALYISKNFGCV